MHANIFFRIKFNIQENVCPMRKKYIDTQKHIFYDYNLINIFWKDFYNWLSKKNLLYIIGFIHIDKHITFLVNNLII